MVVETNKHNSKGSPCSNETQQSSGLVSDWLRIFVDDNTCLTSMNGIPIRSLDHDEKDYAYDDEVEDEQADENHTEN